MRPAGAAELSRVLGACSAGVLGFYGWYFTVVLPYVQQEEAVPLWVWAVTFGLIPLGVSIGGSLASRPLLTLGVGVFTAALRMTMTFALAHHRAPGFLQATVHDGAAMDLLWMLIVESSVWAALAFLSFKVGAALRRRRAPRLSHAG
ncbi:hypothetical protein GCM10012319_73920 [Comamonas sp. KCTC 72670]|nr:hypothetical protein GCM10012319_73920 [Comamonas sp. KCTC 72670]